MRISSIVTKVGDQGSTSLATGVKVSKSNPRIETYGTIDELNSFMGLLECEIAELGNRFDDVRKEIAVIQNELFDLGGELSMPSGAVDYSKQQTVQQQSIDRLETVLESLNEQLEPLKNFVLPGGSRANAIAHCARTICRRAERACVRLHESEPVRAEVLVYLNRLSDWLFVLCRTISARTSIQEKQWQQQK